MRRRISTPAGLAVGRRKGELHRSLKLVPAAIVILYFLITIALCATNYLVFSGILISYGTTLLSTWAMVGLCALLFAMVREQRAGRPQSGWSLAREFVVSRWRYDRFFSVVMPFLCVVPLITSYTLFKTTYLASVGFWFGPTLAQGERALLGGDAWRLTHDLLASPWASQLLDLLYHGWFLPMILGVAMCSFVSPTSVLGWRYLTSYLLLWSVQGSLIAYWMPAAGPSLHALLTRVPTRFDALTARLAAQNQYLTAQGAPGLYSIEYQHKLATLFGANDVAIGGGISAMPSLHNAMAVLFACAAWALGPRLGALATVYAVVIWIGSIHLGWHYALDGVVACGLTILTWHAVGRVPALWPRVGVATDAEPAVPGWRGGEALDQPVVEAA